MFNLAAIGFLVLAYLMHRARKWELATLIVAMIGAGTLASSWNPVAGFNSAIVNLATFTMGAALIIAFMTKNFEKWALPVAIALPFFGQAVDGLFGDLFKMIANLNIVTAIYNQLV